MTYLMLGINHQTAPVAVRERMAMDAEKSRSALTRILASDFVDEAAIVSTCNRVELYSSTEDPEKAREILLRILSEQDPKTADILSYITCKQDHEVVSHLFQVTSSLDSLVTGENQIVGQVKNAYLLAQETASTGYYLNKLFDRALFVAKRVKTETDIGSGNVSIGSVGGQMAKRIFGSLDDKTVLLLGAGEIGELVVRYLNSENVRATYIVNRTFEKAQKLSEEGLGEARSLEDFNKLLLDVDVLITSITGNQHDLSVAKLKDLMRERKNQPLFVIDLGVPRNVEAAAGEIDNLYLYNIDDLKNVAEENKASRTQSVIAAKNIIDEEVRLFYAKHLEFKALPAIASLGKKFEQIRQNELKKTLAKLPHLTDKDIVAINRLTQALVNRVLQDPILSLRDKKHIDEPGVLSAFKKLFRLDDEES